MLSEGNDVWSRKLCRWFSEPERGEEVMKGDAEELTPGCVHHGRFGVAGVQEFLPAKEIQGGMELRRPDLSSER